MKKKKKRERGREKNLKKKNSGGIFISRKLVGSCHAVEILFMKKDPLFYRIFMYKVGIYRHVDPPLPHHHHWLHFCLPDIA